MAGRSTATRARGAIPFDRATSSIGRPPSAATIVTRITIAAEAKIACSKWALGVQKNSANELMIANSVTPAMPSM
ncbi:Uncharacterised protein [Mycobacteroides abscessus subsp. abscessus]|nr:Uncharacterised protein [Mycobacteroides abscessus subsp. abscessus]